MSSNQQFLSSNPQNPNIYNLVHLNQKYVISNRIIGTGASSQVIKGINTKTNQIVAIKKIKCPDAQNDQKLNIYNQISILESITHPNIIKLEDVVQKNNSENKKQIYLIFQYMPLSLREVLNKRKSLTQNEIKHILIQILQGLKYLAENNILHRDLKPQNILISKNLQNVKICDFGLSRKLSGNKSQAQRPLSPHVMTRWYRAPEVILLLSSYSTKIQMWSLGCIFAQLIQAMLPHHMERKTVLFNGKACYPLSPPLGNMRSEYLMKKGFPHSAYDQMFKIIEILGSPSNLDFMQKQDERAKKYLESFDNKQKIRFHNIFLDIPEWAQQMLQKTLKFNPNQRISAVEALQFLKNKNIN